MNRVEKKFSKLSLDEKKKETKTVGQVLEESLKLVVEERQVENIPDIFFTIEAEGPTGWKINVVKDVKTSKEPIFLRSERIRETVNGMRDGTIPYNSIGVKRYDLFELNPGANEYCFFVKHKEQEGKVVKCNVNFLC